MAGNSTSRTCSPPTWPRALGGTRGSAMWRLPRLHPVNIAACVQIVVEHVRQTVAHLLGGQAKAMMVTASRKEAVRWTKEGYIRQRGYLLVAFSEEVNDPDTGPEASTETKLCVNNPRKYCTFRRNAQATLQG